ncbi:MAG: hypothetical protein WBO35_03615 [Candidatus Saccharimonadales bacterium]
MTITSFKIGGAPQEILQPWNDYDGKINGALDRGVGASLTPIVSELINDAFAVLGRGGAIQHSQVDNAMLEVSAFSRVDEDDSALSIVRYGVARQDHAYAILGSTATGDFKTALLAGCPPVRSDVTLLDDGSIHTRLVTSSAKFEGKFEALLRNTHDAAMGTLQPSETHQYSPDPKVGKQVLQMIVERNDFSQRGLRVLIP